MNLRTGSVIPPCGNRERGIEYAEAKESNQTGDPRGAGPEIFPPVDGGS